MADKTIGSLAKAASLQDDSLFVMEQQGEAMSFSGAQIREFAEDAGRDAASTLKKGATYTPSVTPGGTVSWTNDAGLPNPDPVSFPGVDLFNSEVAKAAPVNLLDNSNFCDPINQRENTTYPPGSKRYTIDRWFATTGTEVTVNSGSITLKNTNTEGYNSFYQAISLERIPAAGERVTLACQLADGTIYCGTVNMPSSAGSYNRAFTTADGIQLRLYAAEEDGSARDRVLFYIPAGGSIELRWVAAYVGEYTLNTLPKYHPKGYINERLECRRYYKRYSQITAGPAYTYSSVAAYMTIYLDVPMRATPTISGDAVFNIRSNGTQYQDIPLGTKHSISPYHVRIYLNIDGVGLTGNQSVFATKSSGVIELDADL